MMKPYGKKSPSKAKSGSFKPCKGCPSPKACMAAGKCKRAG
jgi:hypothetical protein